MSVTLVSSPTGWDRAWDTNRCSYTFSSTNYTQPNFNFLIELFLFDPTYTGATGELIGTFKLYPLDDGTCVFNPTSVYKNYLTYDINLSTSCLTDCINSAKQFQLKCYEYYSTNLTTPPAKQGTPYSDTGRGLIFYNGCQALVPYDYIPLNYLQGNNKQWVMSGLTSGKFLTDATEYRLDNEDEAFLWFLSESTELPAKIQYTICYWDPSSAVTYINEPPVIDNYIGLSTTLHDYEESQSDLMPQRRPLSSNYNITGTTTLAPCWSYKIIRGTGVTDLTFGYIDCSGTTKTKFLTSGYLTFCARKNSVVVYEGNYTLVNLGACGSTIPEPIIIVPPPTLKPHITCTNVYDTNISALYADSKMFYFPISMRSLIVRSLVNTNIAQNWMYYKINLIDSSGNTYNKNPFYVYNKCKDVKYSKWQLFWLNPHGGFDTFTFDRKIDINYKIERTTYKQRTPAGGPTSFDSYFGGEKIFNINSNEEITLRSYSLTQKESQLLIQLSQSPVIYLMKEYKYDTNSVYKYGVPYIVVSDEPKYEQKVNSKIIYYEIILKPANQKIIQNY